MSVVEPLLVPIWSKDRDKPTVGTFLSCQRSKAKNLVYSGEIPSVKVGGSRMVAVADLKVYVENLRSEHRTPRSA